MIFSRLFRIPKSITNPINPTETPEYKGNPTDAWSGDIGNRYTKRNA